MKDLKEQIYFRQSYKKYEKKFLGHVEKVYKKEWITAMRYEELTLEGRNAVIEAFRADKTIDKIFLLDGCQDGPIRTILREAKKKDTIINFVKKERLDQMSETGKHQGVIAYAAAYEYGTVEEMLQDAVAKVTNLVKTIEDLKKQGMWFVCGDMGGESMYKLDLTGPIGVVIGSEGDGVSRLVREKCDFSAAIPMFGDIDSLNASVAMGVLSYEIVRQRLMRKDYGR